MLEDIYCKMYKVRNITDKTRLSKIPKVKGLIHHFFSKMANYRYEKFLRKKKNTDLDLNNLNDNVLKKEKIVVSLTSFPKRIDTVWITIETLLRQTLKPDYIILWLAKSEFEKELNSLPENLLKLREKGLEIRFCENLKPHKKYFYSMLEFPKDLVITVDDDVLYPATLIEDLFMLHIQHPKCIICTRGHMMTLDNNQTINKYSDWIHNPIVEEKPSKYLCPTGIGGVLYPPNSLNREVFNRKNIKKLSLNADDLWLKVMALLNGTYVVKSKKYKYEFFTVSKTGKYSLSNINVSENQNDVQLAAILNEYNVDFR